jgi:riboflavin kinase / FMN adenylyltransferase
MKIIENIEDIENPLKNSVITIGNFDGVHKGHQALFHQTIEKAKEINGISIVITFDPHPLRALGKSGPPLITRRDQKIELIKLAKIDYLLCLPFTKEFAQTPPLKFIHDFLIAKLGMKAIIVGPDTLFGKDRKGNISLLKEEGEKSGFSVFVPDWVHDSKTGDERISSTMIRKLVMDGQVKDIPKYLGRFYQIRGKVIKGRNRGGSQLGFPTANIKIHDELCPKFGVYAVEVECTEGVFKGVANIGYSPTFDDHMFTIEVHILDGFSSDIYDTRIRVNIIERLRDEKKFDNIKELSAQINKDIEKTKELLKGIIA